MFETTDPSEMRLIYLSAAVIILSVIAITVFIYGYNGILFYAIAIVAIAIGFYTARGISKTAVPQPAKPKKGPVR